VKTKAIDEEAQQELEKEGTGARKRSRIMGAKENIGNPIWDIAVVCGADQEGLLDFQSKIRLSVSE
jgi:hypothetical protein